MLERPTELGLLHEALDTQDLSSGRIHVRYRKADGSLQGTEGCNLDNAGGYRIITPEELESADESALCENDYPRRTAGESEPT